MIIKLNQQKQKKTEISNQTEITDNEKTELTNIDIQTQTNKTESTKTNTKAQTEIIDDKTK